MQFLLITLGSHGDVHPFVGLGIRLRQRGHRVKIIVNNHFEPLVRSAGLEFIELGKSEEYLALARDPALWSATRGFRVIFGEVARSLEQVYNTIASNLTDDTVVVASSLCLGARIAEDHLKFPMATIHLAPSIFRSVYDVPKLPMLFMPRWLPVPLKRKMWDLGDRFMVDPVIAPAVNALRAKFDLAAVKNVLWNWWHSPRLTIGMFPSWFAAAPIDWPAQVRLTSFPLYDERGIAPLDDRLLEFLDHKDPPIAFTPGSAMFDASGFFETAIHICARLRARGILLTRHRDHVPAHLPENMIHIDYAPFSEFLGRVAALVHHGGIGTTSQCLAAGTPQLILPMSHDQFDNAERCRRLGVAEVMPMRRLSGRRGAQALRKLLGSAQVSRQCATIAKKMSRIDGLEQTCDLLEKLHATASAEPAQVGFMS